jgi:co-chaperonin GroES (HSP10)
MSNESGINPCGRRILIKPKEVLEKSAGGIYLATEKTKEREQLSNTTGIVIDMGNLCYDDETAPWCGIGDKVIFAKYAGLLYKGRDGVQYRLINDTDVTGTLDADVDLVDPNLA